VHPAVELNKAVIDSTIQALLLNFDNVNGGFGQAPKFPHPTEISFMLGWSAARDHSENILNAALYSLKKMAHGGIYDQLGGGFHRYSVDDKWLVPHFEKMLYDNALLAVSYSEAYQITGDSFYKDVVIGTLDFVLREMTDQDGGFYSSLDADSEGEEGLFYIWKKAEIGNLLGDYSELFCRYYNVTTDGNFENHANILNVDDKSSSIHGELGLTKDALGGILKEARSVLFKNRSKRERPLTDDKVLTSWNGLAISGFSRGYQITGDERYRSAAVRAAEFIRDKMIIDNRLAHSYRSGIISGGPFFEDYAFLVAGLIDLYEIDYDYRWIELSAKLTVDAIDMFSDQNGHFFLAPDEQDDHYIRPRDISDGSIPAPGSIMIQSLIKLADITGESVYEKQAEKSMAALSGNIAAGPNGLISAVQAFSNLISDKLEFVVVGDKDRKEFLGEIYAGYFSNRVIVVSDNGSEGIPLLKERQSDGPTTAYICRNFACNLPAANLEELKRQLSELKKN
jgi:uncharacterized protein YyaL (SSP411 family)